MRFRIVVMGTRFCSPFPELRTGKTIAGAAGPVAFGAAAAGTLAATVPVGDPAAGARITSSLVSRPSRPVPSMLEVFTPFSVTIF